MDILSIVIIVLLVCGLVYALNRTDFKQYSTVIYGVAAAILLILLVGYLTGSPILRLR